MHKVSIRVACFLLCAFLHCDKEPVVESSQMKSSLDKSFAQCCKKKKKKQGCRGCDYQMQYTWNV